MSQFLSAPHSLQRKAVRVGGALTLLGVIPRSRIVSSGQDQVGGAAAVKDI